MKMLLTGKQVRWCRVDTVCEGPNSCCLVWRVALGGAHLDGAGGDDSGDASTDVAGERPFAGLDPGEVLTWAPAPVGHDTVTPRQAATFTARLRRPRVESSPYRPCRLA
jgi:hypothetical protein